MGKPDEHHRKVAADRQKLVDQKYHRWLQAAEREREVKRILRAERHRALLDRTDLATPRQRVEDAQRGSSYVPLTRPAGKMPQLTERDLDEFFLTPPYTRQMVAVKRPQTESALSGQPTHHDVISLILQRQRARDASGDGNVVENERLSSRSFHRALLREKNSWRF